MRKFKYGILAMVILLLLAACENKGIGSSENILTSLQDKGHVKVGFANEKPYAYEEDGELKGAAVDIAKAIFKNLGVEEVDGHLSDFQQLIPGLNAGKFDVITAGMAITPDRCTNVAFGEPEMKYGEGLIVESGNPMNLHSYQEIAANPEITVAVMSGATEKAFLLAEGVAESQITMVPDIPASFSAVESGRAHATTGTEMTIKMALESSNQDKLDFVNDFEQPNIEGVPSYGAAAFRQDNEALKDAYNAELKKLKESGELAAIIEPYGFTEEMNVVGLEVTAESVCSGENY